MISIWNSEKSKVILMKASKMKKNELINLSRNFLICSQNLKWKTVKIVSNYWALLAKISQKLNQSL